MASRIQTVRPLGTVTDIASVAKLAADMDYNIKLLYRQSPQVLDELPAPGTIKFLVQEEDGMWHTWSLVAGAGVTLTPNSVTKQLTITSP